MSAETKRGTFGSKVGIVLATAGSAVGLGNVWRFPYETGQNGGAAFILLYLMCIAMLGIPAMLCEFVVGRHSNTNASRAYGNSPWKFVGYMGIFTGFAIMGFYSVVAGWTLQYVVASLSGSLSGDAAFFKEYFISFSSDPVKPVLWTLLFMVITHFIVTRGVQKGLERAAKFMMPMLFILLIVIVVCSLLLPGSWGGVEFLFNPDFSKITKATLLEAFGQAFFSLSIGMSALCTYASYYSKETNLMRSSVQIVVIDCIVAILSGLMIFPAAFSVGVEPDSGPSLIFITLPNVFQQAFSGVPVLGYIISLLFYVLLCLAALTSLISMHEVPTAFVTEEFHLNRKHAATIVTLLAMVVGALCSLSLGACPWIQILGKSLFDCLDFLTANILLTLGGFLTCIYVGWVMPRNIVKDEVTNWGTLRVRSFQIFIFAAKYVCPTLIIMIFLHQFGVI